MDNITSIQEEQFSKSLAQAKFTRLPNNLIQVNNHDNHMFIISVEQLDAMARAFDQAVNDLPFLIKSNRSKETCMDDLTAFDLGPYDNYHTFRLVVRKLNRNIYCSCGIYEDMRTPGAYYYDAKRSIRLQLAHDDVTAIAKAMRS